MMFYNFESDENILKESQPSCKPIRKLGFWIADDNMEGCEWKKECTKNCPKNCKDHYSETKPHTVIAKNDEGFDKPITGRIVFNPKICVLRRTKLLKLGPKNMYCGSWVKGDGELKDENGNKKYMYARRYLFIFLDTDMKPIHKVPIQATLKGTFQIDFDKNYMKFRSEAKNAYCVACNRKQGIMKEQWYSVWVFKVIIGSRVVGKQGSRSEACCVDSYVVPNKDNWTTLCVGRNVEVNELLNYNWVNTEKWALKYEDKTQPQVVDDTDSTSDSTSPN